MDAEQLCLATGRELLSESPSQAADVASFAEGRAVALATDERSVKSAFLAGGSR